MYLSRFLCSRPTCVCSTPLPSVVDHCQWLITPTTMFLPHPLVNVSIMGSLRDREIACSASDLQGLNFGSCVWRAVSSHSSHHPQDVLLARFSLSVHKSGLKPDLCHVHPPPTPQQSDVLTFVFVSKKYILKSSIIFFNSTYFLLVPILIPIHLFV